MKKALDLAFSYLLTKKVDSGVSIKNVTDIKSFFTKAVKCNLVGQKICKQPKKQSIKKVNFKKTFC